MSKELVIASNRHETKVAILEDDQLVEVYFQRANEYSLAGSIHKGRVTRVLPGMQSAFVDLGLERDTFLYVSDFFDETEEYERIPTGREDRPHRTDRSERSERPPIEEVLEARNEARNTSEPSSAVSDGPPENLEPPGEQASSSAPVAMTHKREDEERRGRRSRRRRNRGRGFPESKYASETTLPEPADEPEPVPLVSETAPASSDELEFSVLPGESLAKYRRPEPNPLDEEYGSEHFSIGGAAPALIREATTVHEPDRVETPAEQPVLSFEMEESQSEGFGADAAEETLAAEAASEIIAEEREAGAFSPEEVVDSPEPVMEMISTELVTHSTAVLEESEVLATEEDSTAESAEADAQTSPANLTANVREQGGRYMHRLPRRMRRKMRSETRPGQEGRPLHESRQSPEPTIEGGAAAAAQVQVRAEPQRTVVRSEKPPSPSITELLKEGQEILVQIAKEPLGQKGARITSHIALPGRYVVYMPTLEHMGVSRKIASDEERLRLKKILQTHTAGMTGGFIVRTAGEGKSEQDISADMNFLYNLWLDIRQKSEKRPAPLLLHHDLDIVQRTLRDQVTDSFKAIWMDNEELYESVLRFVQRFQPALVGRIKLYTRSAPIFDAFNITQELEKALRPKVWLKSGGYIVINQTEALVAIDVNTGKYVGKSNRLEDTIVKTNTEAVKEIVRQIRLRDLGGIIVVDFIDMDERKNRQKVMQALEEAMRADKAPNKILQFNDFGLVAITRKRVKQSLERALCMPCPYCEGAGYVKSVQTTVSEILQEAHKIAAAVEGKDVMLRVHPEVAKFLKSNQNRYLEEMEETLRRPVLVKADPALHHDKFDLA